jgi:hypothetical protein
LVAQNKLLETFARNTVDAFEARRRQAALGGHLRRRCATQALSSAASKFRFVVSPS